MESSLLECPVCQSPKFRSLFALSRGADVVACRDCGLVYVPSPLPEVTSLYKASYLFGDDEAHGYENYANEFEAHEKTYTERLQNSELYVGGRGRALDVGCALGYFGKVADERGWEVLITDISEFAVMKASQDFHLRGFVSPAGKIPVKEKKFDLITMFDVLEHISHPRELLDQVRRSLDPRGVVHLTTPNVTSLSARALGKRWYHFKPEEHLIYFSPKTLQLALEKSGFEVLKIQPVHSYMAVGDILMRLRAYSQKLSDFGLKVAKLLHLDRKVIRVATGRVEAWARPRAAEVSATGARKAFPVERETTPILGLVCCPNCKGELYPEGEELTCMLCDSIFAIEFGVINFSKYTKKLHRKSV